MCVCVCVCVCNQAMFVRLCLRREFAYIFMYYKTENSASLRYFDTCFMLNIGGVSNRQGYDSLSMYYLFFSHI